SGQNKQNRQQPATVEECLKPHNSRSFSDPKNPRSSQRKRSSRSCSGYHNRLVLAALSAQPLGFVARNLNQDICCDGPVFRYHVYLWSRDHLLCRKLTTICPRHLFRRLAIQPSTRPRTS